MLGSGKDTRATVRVFRVSFHTNLDRSDKAPVPMGVFGELLLKERYAIGLIARRTTAASELASVGRLARNLVEHPFDGLKRYFNQVWNAEVPRSEFAAVVGASGSSLRFVLDRTQEYFLPIHLAAEVGEGSLETKAWCKATLRKALRDCYSVWINDDVSETPDQSEEVETVAKAA